MNKLIAYPTAAVILYSISINSLIFSSKIISPIPFGCIILSFIILIRYYYFKEFKINLTIKGFPFLIFTSLIFIIFLEQIVSGTAYNFINGSASFSYYNRLVFLFLLFILLINLKDKEINLFINIFLISVFIISLLGLISWIIHNFTSYESLSYPFSIYKFSGGKFASDFLRESQTGFEAPFYLGLNTITHNKEICLRTIFLLQSCLVTDTFYGVYVSRALGWSSEPGTSAYIAAIALILQFRKPISYITIIISIVYLFYIFVTFSYTVYFSLIVISLVLIYTRIFVKIKFKTRLKIFGILFIFFILFVSYFYINNSILISVKNLDYIFYKNFGFLKSGIFLEIWTNSLYWFVLLFFIIFNLILLITLKYYTLHNLILLHLTACAFKGAVYSFVVYPLPFFFIFLFLKNIDTMIYEKNTD